MESQKRHIRVENHYSKISLNVKLLQKQKRQRLVHMVLQEGLLISKSGKRLGIKLSTAKLIVKRFKETGTYFESKEERFRRLSEEERKRRVQPVGAEIPSLINQQNPQEFTIGPKTESVIAVWWVQSPCSDLSLYNYSYYANWM